jgi:GWxTD domain-containing protein
MRRFRPAVLLVGGLFLWLPAAARAQKLDGDDERFLKEVGPIILPDEKALFEKLEDKAARLVFQEIFWARRDPDLATSENEFRRQYVKDRKTADRRYSVPRSSGSVTDCGRLFILFGEPDRIERDRDWNRVVVGDTVMDMEIGQPTVMVRRPEVWVYRDRPERRLSIARVAIAFDEECRGRGDFAQQLDRMAATKIVHPNIDYKVGADGHLVKRADRLAGETPSHDSSRRP